MNGLPLISVIVPTYNRAGMIKKTLYSLLNQSYTNFEIIVVDDGSTDDTEERVKEVRDARITYYKKKNEERAVARNFGASLANGDYVNFFDSDDIALNNHLQEAAATIQKNQLPEWFHLGYAWAKPDNSIIKKENKFKGTTLNRLLLKGNKLSCNGVFIRKDIIEENKFNEDRALSASEDFELWCRLAARYPLHYSNSITSLIIDHEARSVRVMNGESLIKRLHLLIRYLKNDEKVVNYFGKALNQIEGDSISYIALHLANLSNYKLKSIKYLAQSIYMFPLIALRKRTFATVKNLVIKWQRF